MYKNQFESADLQHFAIGQLMLIDTPALDIGAVQRAHITHQIARPDALHFCVSTRDRDVVEEDGAVGVSPNRHHIGVERITGPRFRAVQNYKQSFVDPEGRAVNAHTAAIQIDRNMVRCHFISSQRVSAGRAEASPVRIAVSAFDAGSVSHTVHSTLDQSTIGHSIQ